MFKLVFFVPETHLEETKQALFAAGAGKIGNYDCCAWQTLGQGQFRPLAGSDAYLGDVDKVEVLSEFRVEMVCEASVIEQALSALRRAHPYETPAIDVIRLESLGFE